MKPLGLVWLLVWAVSFGCSLEKAPLADVRGHSLDLNRVVHASGMRHADRYCHNCHGETLQGGDGGEPSCYRCHGRNWQSTGYANKFAPADHSVVNDIFSHHPNYLAPEGTCAVSSCHGANLQGDNDTNTPGCYTCHDQVW